MLQRKYLFPRVIEMNYQAGRRLGVNVYLIDGGTEYLLIDIGFEDTVDEIVELIRQMDFNLSAFKMNNLLFCGDNIYKDSCVGVIDAHHGSHIPDFLASLERIKGDDAAFLLPSHGPVFKRDKRVLQKAIDRLTQYQHMADFGTCATDWPLLDEWEADVLAGRMPKFG